ncbi:protein arginine methyltransferase NDUFAF7, mitochondrial isoform X2 [Stegostoma tigrinum]|uniref:protein arginine methyltransferase NDUFAF7, mitochondrial isoform X2 n=1 Tax=Stegostoma tigrinum TaxID=3053191 RepID=UPI00202AE6CC|nr:protein arginine methyltransferase NDUFAF7, mitochondrial isoform X2 [Stegostoma tigrinum]
MIKLCTMRFFSGIKHLCSGVSSYISKKGSPDWLAHNRAQWIRLCSRTSEIIKESNQDSMILKHLILKIKSTGPISVAEYMREVLTNPVTGYYQHRDVLGPQGDFITSPEISQIFGELLGVWCVSEWMAAGKPKTFQLVELGPGRGTLASDALRVFSQLHSVLKDSEISVHLVEVSPKLSEVQAQLLTEGEHHLLHDPNGAIYKTGTTKTGLPISWYKDLQDVPKEFSFYIAHEFFDVLPIHKFQKTKHGWREILIDIEPNSPGKLRFVLAPHATLASKTLIQRDDERDHIEICPEAGIIVQNLATRITEDGGAALIADYGHNGTKTDTFRGFRGHQLHDVLTAPGTADLTADVDFSYLRQMTKCKVTSLGPIPQHEFLKNMGIDVRLQVLLRNASDPATHTDLIDSYDVIMNPEKMGNRFKFFVLLPCNRLISSQDTKNMKRGPMTSPVAGFSELQL